MKAEGEMKYLEKSVIILGGDHANNVRKYINTLTKDIDVLLDSFKKSETNITQEQTDNSLVDQFYPPTADDLVVHIKVGELNNYSSWYKFTPDSSIQGFQHPPFILSCGGIAVYPGEKNTYSISILPCLSVGKSTLRGDAPSDPPRCTGWHVGKDGIPTLTPQWLKSGGVCRDCQYYGKECKSSSYKIMFVSGFAKVDALMELGVDDATLSSVKGAPAKDLGIPIKTRDLFVPITTMGIIEARGVWGFKLFFKTPLKSRGIVECKIRGFTKQAEGSYCFEVAYPKEKETVLAIEPLSVMDKPIDPQLVKKGKQLFTSIMIPLRNRVLQGKSFHAPAAPPAATVAPSGDTGTAFDEPPF